jgi:hypothetical protein
MIDGTMIRLYYSGNEWCVGTKGHTDASKAKWSSEKSFRQMWDECCASYPEFSTEDLSINHTHVFLIQHVDNKIVCPVTQNNIYLTDVYDNRTLSSEDLTDPAYSTIKVDRPKKLSFDTPKELSTFMELNDSTVKGVFLYNKKTGARTFVLTNKYEEMQKLKGNTLDTGKHYLDLRSGNNHYSYTKHFPEFLPLVLHIENTIASNIRFMHNLYMEKHIRKNPDIVLTHEHKTYMFPLHGFYMRTGQVMNKTLVENLMFVVNRYFGLTDLSETH